MPRLFIPQEWIDQANIDDKVQLAGELLTVKADGQAYRLTPAARFLRVEGGDADPQQLVGKVKKQAQLEALGAETVAESALVGDTAYLIVPGFIAEFTGSGDPVSAAFR